MSRAAASTSIDVDGLQVVARTYGAGEITYVLIHGLGMSSSYFRPLAQRLAKNARVVCLNLPGFGPARDPDRSLRIGQFAAVARRAVRQLGIGPAVWVGHSMGTQIVVEAAAQEPEIATRVVLLAPIVNQAEQNLPLVLARFAQAGLRETPTSVLAALRAYLRVDPRYALEILPAVVTYPLLNRVAQLQCPVVVVIGELDALTPREWMDQLVAAAGRGRGHVIYGAAHAVVHSHAAETAAVIAEDTVPRWRPRLRELARDLARAAGRGPRLPAPRPDDDRPPVLLLPGVLERPGYLLGLASYLAAKYRVLTVAELGWNLASLEASVDLAFKALGDAEGAVLVAHSKGGLIGKRMLLHPDAGRLRGMVTIATPFNGTLLSPLQHLGAVRNSPLGLFHPQHPALRDLAADDSVNGRIVNLIPTRDPLISQDPSLPGATNITLEQVGHFAPLRSPEVWELVASHVAQLRGS